MENLLTKFGAIKHTCIPTTNTLCTNFFKRNYMENVACKRSEEKIHPYKQIHPWKSLQEFSRDLMSNLIYNKDGLVVLNKPYGISTKVVDVKNCLHYVPNSVNYTLEDALPHICKELNYPDLRIVRKPEKYMTGVTILVRNSNVQAAVELALRRGNNCTKEYWVITNRVPKQLKAKEKLAMKVERKEGSKYGKPVIVTSWSNNAVKRNEVKLLNIDYEVLSNSTLNLCSLLQIRSSTVRWHALRLFAATFLYCPILGDNLCASQVQKIANTYVRIDPFLYHANVPPKLDKELLNLLCIKSSQQSIIPVHIHLRSIVLPSFLPERKDLVIEAPLLQPFEWTCRQLQFKYFLENENNLCK